jgi:hypothetical protein
MSEANHPISDARTNLQGTDVSKADQAELLAALDKAFDYRGDVTLTLTDGKTLEGYIFDRRRGKTLDDSVVRMMPKDSAAKVEVPYARIQSLVFSGKDTAAGKSWETWLRKYVEKKVKGEKGDIEPEALD